MNCKSEKKQTNQVTFLSHENLKLHHGQDENLPIIILTWQCFMPKTPQFTDGKRL